MARLARLFLPSIPQHVIQRGNNRQACFYAEEDYRFYLECLGEAARKYRVSVHAYVLMTNHVHLLMTPSSAASTFTKGKYGTSDSFDTVSERSYGAPRGA
ncbi:MAG: transposase [Gammaproteobacteria bacterium]